MHCTYIHTYVLVCQHSAFGYAVCMVCTYVVVFLNTHFLLCISQHDPFVPVLVGGLSSLMRGLFVLVWLCMALYTTLCMYVHICIGPLLNTVEHIHIHTLEFSGKNPHVQNIPLSEMLCIVAVHVVGWSCVPWSGVFRGAHSIHSDTSSSGLTQIRTQYTVEPLYSGHLWTRKYCPDY